MKKAFALMLAFCMLLSLSAAPALAERSAMPADAADLNEALNVPGGTLQFTTGGEYPWVVDGDAAKSTNSGVSSSTSSVQTTVSAGAGELLTFDFRSCGEGADSNAWDGLYLYIDGELEAKWGNHPEWDSYSCELSAGVHTVQFTFKKDGSVNVGEDCAFVDNVHLTQPVMAGSIVAGDVTVSAGRRVQIEYEVLPEEAFNKAVTFTSANPGIATVTDEGVVKGIAVGVTTVTIASAAVPSVSTDITVTVTEALPIAQLNGFATYDFGADQSNDMRWVSFTDAEPETVSGLNLMSFNVSAAAYYDGTVYGYYFDGTDQNPIRTFFKMDHESRQVTNSENAHQDGVFSMAYDYTRGNMYAVCGMMETRYLGIVDLETGEIEYVGELTAPMMMTFAIDDRGVGYGLTMDTQNAKLYRVDLDTAECTLVGELGMGLAYLQSMTYDYETGMMYWARAYNTTTEHGLYVLNTETAEAELLGVIGDGTELTGLYTTAAPDEAGNPGDTDLSGSVTIADAVLALRHSLELITLEGQAFANGDVNRDGELTVADAVQILRYAMGLITNL